jgi:hypothetical protein
MALDLAKILPYARPDGSLADAPRTGYLSVIDGIVGGEGNGPMAADARPAGLIVAGANPAAVDWVAARLMGFDPARLKIIDQAFAERHLPIAAFSAAAIELCSNGPLPAIGGQAAGKAGEAIDVGPAFRPHFGWSGAIEFR